MDTNTNDSTFKIGTRGSELALWQAREVAALLDMETEEVIVTTSGDRFRDIPLQGQLETGFFTKEIESQLLGGEIDIAVHSLKDLPTQSHDLLILGAYLPRAAAADILLIHPDWHDTTGSGLIPLKEGCKVGATSLRRQSLMKLYGPQAKPALLRGNVPTRVQKCKDLEFGAIVLAQAGLDRLELDIEPLAAYRLNPEIWLPAPGQGVIAVQVRRHHSELQEQIKILDHPPSRDAVIIERKLLAHFEGGCHTAFGAYAQPSAKNPGLWDTRIGLDRPRKRGWGQVLLEGRTLEEMVKITPSQIGGFEPLEINKQEDLCRRIQL